MDSQSLINGLKDLFASLGAKTSDSNYAVGLFDKTSKEPKGVMGMSDLASVLGVDRVQAEYYQSEFYLDLFDKNNHGVQVLFRHKDGHTGIRYRYMEDGQWPSTWIDV